MLRGSSVFLVIFVFALLGNTVSALAGSRCGGLEGSSPDRDGSGDSSIQFSAQDPMRGMAVSSAGHILVSSAYKAALFAPDGTLISLEGATPDSRAEFRHAVHTPGARSTLVFSAGAQILVRADQGNVICSNPPNLPPATGLFRLAGRTAAPIPLPPLEFGEFRKFLALAPDGNRQIHEIRLDRERNNPVHGWLEFVDLENHRFQRIPLPNTLRGILNPVASATFLSDRVLISTEYGQGAQDEGAVTAYTFSPTSSTTQWTPAQLVTPSLPPAGLSRPVRGDMTVSGDRYLFLRGFRDATLGWIDLLAVSPRVKKVSPNVGTILAHRVSPDGLLLAIAGSDSIALYSAANPNKVNLRLRPRFQEDPESTTLFEGRIYDIAFSPDSRRIAGACEDGFVRIWDTQTGKQVYEKRYETDALTHIAYLPGGSRVATIQREGTVFRTWLLPEGAR